MNCKNLKQKLDRTLYCKYKKSDIKISECSNCKYKEYKGSANNCKQLQTTAMKSKPSKRTKALSIAKKVKLTVWERDDHKCIFCGKYVEWNYANSHYIKRSHGGLGIEQNIITNCETCHNLFDDSIHRKDMLPIAKKYFQSKYSNWNEEDLIYRK
ncbi:MAG: hypothetical protein LIR50_06010 [Bacillota bacterium]|nr:hypothetical protein [Bacillota bacterium]